jgi:hypothetical protein
MNESHTTRLYMELAVEYLVHLNRCTLIRTLFIGPSSYLIKLHVAYVNGVDDKTRVQYANI